MNTYQPLTPEQSVAHAVYKKAAADYDKADAALNDAAETHHRAIATLRNARAAENAAWSKYTETTEKKDR